MAMRLDHQLREQIFHKHTTFPSHIFKMNWLSYHSSLALYIGTQTSNWLQRNFPF